MSEYFENNENEKAENSEITEEQNKFEKEIPEEAKAPEEINVPEEPKNESAAQTAGEYAYTYRRADEPRQNPYYVNTQNPNAQYGQPYGGGAHYGEQQNRYEQPRGNYSPYPPQYPPQYAPFYAPRQEQKKKEKKEKKKRSVIAVVVVLCICTVILSCGAGYLGTLIYKNVHGTTGGDTAVLYKSVDTTVDVSETSVAAVAEAVSNSVVEITTEFVTTGYFSFGQYVTKGAGSGVIISEDGYIVTNNHVISDTDNGNTLADKINVTLRNGETYTASVVGRDEDADVAVIKIEATGLSAAVWGDSDDVKVGEQIVVVGNPLGRLGGTVTTGIISASGREITIDNTKMNLIQTDAAVNPGNSGGGMFNMKGELVGIVNAKSSGTGIEGLGFAIPSNDARNVAQQLLEYGYVKGKQYIGVVFYEANASGWFSTGSSGILYVYSCEEGYNDDVLKYGDQVVSVDGQAVSTRADVKAIITKHEIGDKVPVTIIRNNKTMEIEIEIFEYQPKTDGVTFTN